MLFDLASCYGARMVCLTLRHHRRLHRRPFHPGNCRCCQYSLSHNHKMSIKLTRPGSRHYRSPSCHRLPSRQAYQHQDRVLHLHQHPCLRLVFFVVVRTCLAGDTLHTLARPSLAAVDTFPAVGSRHTFAAGGRSLAGIHLLHSLLHRTAAAVLNCYRRAWKRSWRRDRASLREEAAAADRTDLGCRRRVVVKVRCRQRRSSYLLRRESSSFHVLDAPAPLAAISSP